VAAAGSRPIALRAQARPRIPVPSNPDRRLWAAILWLSIILLTAGAVIGAIAGSW
jgi:hypothetical protein